MYQKGYNQLSKLCKFSRENWRPWIGEKSSRQKFVKTWSMDSNLSYYYGQWDSCMPGYIYLYHLQILHGGSIGWESNFNNCSDTGNYLHAADHFTFLHGWRIYGSRTHQFQEDFRFNFSFWFNFLNYVVQGFLFSFFGWWDFYSSYQRLSSESDGLLHVQCSNCHFHDVFCTQHC